MIQCLTFNNNYITEKLHFCAIRIAFHNVIRNAEHVLQI